MTATTVRPAAGRGFVVLAVLALLVVTFVLCGGLDPDVLAILGGGAIVLSPFIVAAVVCALFVKLIVAAINGIVRVTLGALNLVGLLAAR